MRKRKADHGGDWVNVSGKRAENSLRGKNYGGRRGRVNTQVSIGFISEPKKAMRTVGKGGDRDLSAGGRAFSEGGGFKKKYIREEKIREGFGGSCNWKFPGWGMGRNLSSGKKF